MILTLHTDFVNDKGVTKRQIVIKRNLPNNDAFHIFESWIHLSRCEEMPSRIIDSVMNRFYGIVSDEAKSALGLTDLGYRNGDWDIDDPTVHNKHEMSSIITVNV
jgi:hypothetical protein|tara:strand:- start:893 stop:1207 length:315 start_codon:yes stop_codon:yes gene_type:complete